MITVTYGGELAAARSLLTDSHLNADTTRPPPQLFGIIVGQVYRTLYRHTVLLTGGVGHPLADALADAARHAVSQVPDPPPAVDAVTEPVPAAGLLTRARDHLGVAMEVLASQFGPDGDARTPAGIALTAGVGRTSHLAAVGRLAALAARAHLHAGDGTAATDTGSAAEAIRRVTTAANAISAMAEPGDSFLDGLRPALYVTGAAWPAVTSHTGVHEALDAARTWLAQHYATDLTGQQIRQFAGAGLALVQELGYLARQHGNDVTAGLRLRYATEAWRNAYLAADNVVSLDHSDGAAGPTALINAERWVREQLRAGGTWRNDNLALTGQAEWSTTAREITRALPDLATMLHHGTRFSATHHDLYTPAPRHPGNPVIQNPEWIRAEPQTPAVLRLTAAVADLREPSVLLSSQFEASPHTGLHEATRLNRYLVEVATTPRLWPSEPSQEPASSISRLLEPLPPAAAALRERAHGATRRGGATTSVSIALAHDVVQEIQRLQATIDELGTRISGSTPPTRHPAETTPLRNKSAAPADFQSPDLALPEPGLA